jgi:hypothetical protein
VKWVSNILSTEQINPLSTMLSLAPLQGFSEQAVVLPVLQ